MASLGTTDASVPPEDGGYTQFVQKYFTTDSFVNQTTQGFRDGEVTKYDLLDHATVLRDYSRVLRAWQESGFSWVNQGDFIPYEYTDKLVHEVQFIEFGDNQFPEPAPMEVAPRYITITRNTVIETSRRYNLGFPFDNQNMATAPGQEEFGMFSARITQMFTELVSRLSLVKLLSPAVEDGIYFNPNEDIGISTLDKIFEDELMMTFFGNRNSDGCVPLLFNTARKMEKINPPGGWPSHVLFNQEKQLLLKFNDKFNTPGEMMSKDFHNVIYDMSFRPVPHFSTSNTKEDLDVGSLMASRIEIGNSFPVRNIMLDIPIEKVCIAQQGRISLFSENDNGLKDLTFVELNQRDLRWDEDGYLHANHEDVETDMYTYFDSYKNKYVPCRIIGDMKPEKLSDIAITKMVESFLKGQPVSQWAADVKAYKNGGAAAGVQERLKELANRAYVILGNNKNPIFTDHPLPSDDPDGDVDTTRMLRLLINVFKANPDGYQVMDELDHDIPYPKPAEGFSDDLRQEGKYSDKSDIFGNFPPESLSEPIYNTIRRGLLRLQNQYMGSNALRINKLLRSLEAYHNSVNNINLCENDWAIIGKLIAWLEQNVNAAGTPEMSETDLAKVEHMIGCLQAIGRSYCVDDAIDMNDALKSLRTLVFKKTGYTEPELVYDEFKDHAIDGGMFPVMTTTTPVPPGTRTFPRPGVHPKVYHMLSSFDTRFIDQDDPEGKKTRIGDVPDSVGDNENISANVKRVDDLFSTEFLRGIGYLILLTPIHRDVFTRMLRNDVFIPHEWVLIRNQMTYETEGCCLVQASGGGVGKAKLSYPAAELGTSAMDMTGMMHVAQMVSIVISDFKKRWLIPYLWYRRVLGGASAELYSMKEWDAHRSRQYFTKGVQRASMTPCSVPIGSPITKQLHVSGKWHSDEEGYNYDSWEFYGKHLGFNEFEREFAPLHTRISTQVPNGMCFEGTYCMRGLDGRPMNAHENAGHHGMEFPGVKEVRQRGLKLISDSAKSCFVGA